MNSVAIAVQTPHAIIQASNFYSILFNFLGQDPRNIGIKVNEKKQELTVLSRKDTQKYRNGSFWVFNVPGDGRLTNLWTEFRGGVLAINIPRKSGLTTLQNSKNKKEN